MAAPNDSHDRFATTRWSMVLQPESADRAIARTALAELAQGYWYPVYAYVRRCGHAPSIAQYIARCFLSGLMPQFRDDRVRATGSNFRYYLLDQLNAFLGGDWREIVENDNANDLVAPPDLEARNQRDHANAASAEQAYQHSFALEIISRAFKRLHIEAEQTGHLQMYRALEPHLTRGPSPAEYDALATQLEIRPLALVVALKRLRQRFRELVGQELSDTVTSARDLALEQAALHSLLRGTQASR